MVKKDILIVVDMQYDFIDGALGTPEAKMIVPNVIEKIKSYNNVDSFVFATRDTHDENYLETEEGKNLPVKHCIPSLSGWCIHDDVYDALQELGKKFYTVYINKPTFGALEFGARLRELSMLYDIENIEIVGLCTDICVISNAVIAKSALPNAHIKVDASCCAGVTPESHNRALDSMQTLQVEIVNRGKEPWIK